ncbi:MAG: hypothetical protein KKF93_00030, partial [Candidatus Omnitrophica bacterium]|nr:hypothetical protein [Candidatus Omnitrophota bacterium]
MKIKSIILFLFITVSLIIPVKALCEEPAIVNDIVFDIQGDTVKISIAANKALQIETFKNESGSNNYIVLDFIGDVYCDLPPIIEVNKGIVDKISLIRGEEKKITIFSKDYYALDFLAANLKNPADYDVSKNGTIIDLNIGPAQIRAAKTIEKKIIEAKPQVKKEEKKEIKQEVKQTVKQRVKREEKKDIRIAAARPIPAKKAELSKEEKTRKPKRI